MAKKNITVAPRELKRNIGEAVGKSFIKTLTEPLTNSDSALKKRFGVSHSSGIVEEMLKLKTGDRLDTSALKSNIRKTQDRTITVQIYRSAKRNFKSRHCRIIDTGTGMSCEELESKFATYASAKAKGEKTRSLFGRGALDVLLYHQDSVIYSVKNDVLSICKIFFPPKKQPYLEADELGKACSTLLREFNLPKSISDCGTVVEFVFKEGTRIPQQDTIIRRLSSFYMLRLIAMDPNTSVVVEQYKSDGTATDKLKYDFPIGTVLASCKDTLNLGKDGTLDVSILVARSDQPLLSDNSNIETRENGLLFVDDNDAVMDITLLPEYDKIPYLQHIFGIVRITDFRDVLEKKLEADEPEAVLSTTREGFNRKSAIANKLFALVEKCVKPVYEKEQRRQRQGGGKRSAKLEKSIKEALSHINKFTNSETDEDGTVDPKTPDRKEAIYFSMDKTQLYSGITKRISVYVNGSKVKNGEIVLFESSNSEIKIEPESEIVKIRKNATRQRFVLSITCSSIKETGDITAITIGKDGKEYSAKLKIVTVEEMPQYQPPEHIEFTQHRYSGTPNSSNKTILNVNLKAFAGKPEITFWLESVQGNVSIGDVPEKRIKVKVKDKHIDPDLHIARIIVPFSGTAWGQSSILKAKAKLSNGRNANAKCRVVFERPPGANRFTDFYYEELDRRVLADAAGDKIYINAKYPVHQRVFGKTQDDFDKSLEENPQAQIRAAQILVEAVVYYTASMKHTKGGQSGLKIESDDPITSLRSYIESRRMDLEPNVLKALAPDVYT